MILSDLEIYLFIYMYSQYKDIGRKEVVYEANNGLVQPLSKIINGSYIS